MFMCSRRISKRVSVDNFLKNSFILQTYGDIHLIENGNTLFEQLHVSVDLLVMKGLLFLSGAPFINPDGWILIRAFSLVILNSDSNFIESISIPVMVYSWSVCLYLCTIISELAKPI